LGNYTITIATTTAERDRKTRRKKKKKKNERGILMRDVACVRTGSVQYKPDWPVEWNAANLKIRVVFAQLCGFQCRIAVQKKQKNKMIHESMKYEV
jgi:hypothetical protein